MRVKPSRMGPVSLQEKTQERWFLSPLICKPGRELSSDIRSAGTLVVDFPASRTVSTKCLLFKPLCLWYSVRAELLQLISTDGLGENFLEKGIIEWILNDDHGFKIPRKVYTKQYRYKDGATGSVPCSPPPIKGSGAIWGLVISKIQREMRLES